MKAGKEWRDLTEEQIQEIVDLRSGTAKFFDRVRFRLETKAIQGARGWRKHYDTMPGITGSLYSFIRAEVLGDNISKERSLVDLVAWVFIRWHRDFGGDV